MTVTYQEVDIRALTDAQLDELHAFFARVTAEVRPEDPVQPRDVLALSLANIAEYVEISELQARSGELLVGRAEAVVTHTDDNQHLMYLELQVLPEWRRQGIGRHLLGFAAGAAERMGRRSILSTTSERVPAGAAFAARVGARAGLEEHINRLALADADSALIDRWVAEGPGRAPGYSLVAIDGDVPDDELPGVLEIIRVMNDAPTGDLEIEDERTTPEEWRQNERARRARGNEQWMLLARHDATGVNAGFTEVAYNPAMPKTVHQQGTAVHPDHRGHGLGKWLKATMLQRVIGTRADAVDVRTHNANSNAAMLAINHQLGFRPYIASTAWQVGLDKVRQYLAGAATTAT